MSLQPSSTHADVHLTSYFWSGETLRSRSVSSTVLIGTVNVPALPLRVTSDCDREISGRLALEPGDVETLSLARARMRWPDYKLWVQAAEDWIRHAGLPDLLADCDVALMACRGAKYHHDAEQYGSAAFCNLFLSEDKGLDLLFPISGHRIPLTRGTVVIFDTAQPHGVIERGGTVFNGVDFPSERDYTQLFLTWELPLENADIARALGIDFDIDPATALRLNEAQVWMNGMRVSVCPQTGNWRWGTA